MKKKTTYVALLRAINVGGNSIIKMVDLKAVFEKNGFENVRTYIQSGNVVFESSENEKELEKRIENILSKAFKYNSTVLVRSQVEIQKVLAEVPKEWKKRKDLRCYLAFIKEPLLVQQAVKEVELKEGVDFVKAGGRVLYLSTLLSGLSKSNLSKLITKKIYKQMTMRNYNTTQKIAEMMEK